MRVLVIEDEPRLAAQLRAALQNAGYAVEQAGDGEKGEFVGEVEPYDAVILDVSVWQVEGLGGFVLSSGSLSQERLSLLAAGAPFEEPRSLSGPGGSELIALERKTALGG